jgi:integrase
MAKRGANNRGTITRRADGRWEGRVSLPGGKRRCVYGKSQREVSQKLTELLRIVEEGRSIPDEKQTIEQFLHFWLETHALHVRGSSMRPYDLYVRDYLIPRFGAIPLVKLTPQKVQMGLTEMLTDGISAYSVRYSHRVLKQALGVAVDLEILARNPARKTRLPRLAKRNYVTWSEEQVRIFLHSTRGHLYEIAFLLMVTTAMRIGEVVALRWDDIDFKHKVIHVRSTQTYGRNHKRTVGDTKTDSSRRDIALLPQVAGRLKQLLIERKKSQGFCSSDLVMLNARGGLVSNQSIWGSFVRATQEAGLPRIRPHDVRHTAATLLIKRKVNIKVVSQMLGHASVSITMNIYAHVLDEMEREATEMMGEIIGDDE